MDGTATVSSIVFIYVHCSSPSELMLYFCSLLWYTKRTTEKGVWNHMDASKIIRLTEEEQAYLKKYIRTGTHPAKSIIRAQALLRLDRTGKTDHVHYNRIAADIGISKQGLYNMRDSYLETDRKSTRLNSSHPTISRMPSSA